MKVPHILLVEDEKAHMALIQRAFQKRKQTVELSISRSIAQAQKFLAERKPDLLIADLRLPDGQGTDLLSDKQEILYPIIIMTSRGDEKVAVQTIKLGAIDYIVKSEHTLLEMPHIAERAIREWSHIQKLKQSRLEWQETFDAVSDLIVITELDGQIRQCNLSAQKYFENELIDCQILEIFSTEHTLKEELPKNFEVKLGRCYFHVSRSPLKNQEPHGFVYVLRDISERKDFEVKIQHTSKLNALGILSSGIAHEIGNPLASISARLQRLQKKREPEFLEDSILLLENQVARMGRILHRISSFSKSPSRKMLRCNIKNLLEDTIALLSMDPRSKKITMILKVETPLRETFLLKDQTQQVFINIGINAFDAMVEGILTISVLLRDDHFEIIFADQGCGISQEDQEKIFEPFFSTKEVEKGMGLGLYLSMNYIQAQGGNIEIKSEVEKGSQFIISLPLLETLPSSSFELI